MGVPTPQCLKTQPSILSSADLGQNAKSTASRRFGAKRQKWARPGQNGKSRAAAGARKFWTFYSPANATSPPKPADGTSAAATKPAGEVLWEDASLCVTNL